MPVDISTLDIATPLPISASNPMALGLNGNCNGQQASSPPHALASTWNGQVFDFHGGIYNQIDFTPQHSGGGWLGLHHQPAVAQPRLAPGWGGVPCGSHAVRVLLAPCQEGTCSSLRSRGIRVR